jgi:putative hydrolase of the HAD superfamily
MSCLSRSHVEDEKNLVFKGVMIDYGDTLAYTDVEANGKYLQEVALLITKYGCSCDPDDAKSALSALYRKSSMGEMKDLDEFWSILLKNFGVSQERTMINRLNEARRKYYLPAIRLYDGVISALSMLEKKYLLVLVSNCGLGTREVLEYIGLARFFEHMILSYEVGVRKPDRRIYVQALRRIGVNADQCIFVADEISDLEGARNVGMVTLLVRQGENRFIEAENPDFRPDFECGNISQIMEFL